MSVLVAETLVAAVLAVTGPPDTEPVKDERVVCETRRCRRRTARKRKRKAERRARRLPHRTALASWYGPSLYGNPLGCGGRLWPSTIGVAHKALGCGTKVHLCARRCLMVRVIDRGPYVGGREFDLTAATAVSTGFAGVGVVRVRVMR